MYLIFYFAPPFLLESARLGFFTHISFTLSVTIFHGLHWYIKPRPTCENGKGYNVMTSVIKQKICLIFTVKNHCQLFSNYNFTKKFCVKQTDRSTNALLYIPVYSPIINGRFKISFERNVRQHLLWRGIVSNYIFICWHSKGFRFRAYTIISIILFCTTINPLHIMSSSVTTMLVG